MNLKSVLEKFNNQDMLVDIYYEQMSTEAWLRIFEWLSQCSEVASVNCYNPKTGENLEYLPKDISDYIDQEGFYCFVSLMVSGINLFLRFYMKSEIECDVSPSDIESEEKLVILLAFLEKIRAISGVPKYIVCPENFKKGAFIVNGNAINENT